MELVRRTKPEYRADPQVSIGDPALAEYLGMSRPNYAGVELSEGTVLGLSAVWRSVALIAGAVASLPLKSYRNTTGGRREEISSFLDSPHPDMTPFEWKELVLTHELVWGNAYLLHIYGGAGQLVGLKPIPPPAVVLTVNKESGLKEFKVKHIDGSTRDFSSLDLTHIPALGTDGVRGLSPVGVARHSLGAAMASDKAAGRIFKNGLMLGGILRPKQGTLSKTQKNQVTDGLKGHGGADHAGDVAFVPTDVDFTPWSMNAVDAQFLESRHFGVEEVARWFGVPRELLSQSGASSWGSGIQEIVRAFARFTLSGWTSRNQERLSMLLPRPQFCEFDYSGFIQPSPQEEIELLIRQVESGFLTVDEGRAVRNLGPKPTATQTEPIEEDINSVTT